MGIKAVCLKSESLEMEGEINDMRKLLMGRHVMTRGLDIETVRKSGMFERAYKNGRDQGISSRYLLSGTQLSHYYTVNFLKWLLCICNQMEEGFGDPEWDKILAKKIRERKFFRNDMGKRIKVMIHNQLILVRLWVLLERALGHHQVSFSEALIFGSGDVEVPKGSLKDNIFL